MWIFSVLLSLSFGLRWTEERLCSTIYLFFAKQFIHVNYLFFGLNVCVRTAESDWCLDFGSVLSIFLTIVEPCLDLFFRLVNQKGRRRRRKSRWLAFLVTIVFVYLGMHWIQQIIWFDFSVLFCWTFKFRLNKEGKLSEQQLHHSLLGKLYFYKFCCVFRLAYVCILGVLLAVRWSDNKMFFPGVRTIMLYRSHSLFPMICAALQSSITLDVFFLYNGIETFCSKIVYIAVLITDEIMNVCLLCWGVILYSYF